MPSGTFSVHGTYELTGRIRFRTSLFGRPVAQVEEERKTGSVRGPGGPNWTGSQTRWRDADFTDLLVIEIDASLKPKVQRP